MKKNKEKFKYSLKIYLFFEDGFYSKKSLSKKLIRNDKISTIIF